MLPRFDPVPGLLGFLSVVVKSAGWVSGNFRGGAERRCGVAVKLMLILGLVYYTIVDGIGKAISYGGIRRNVR